MKLTICLVTVVLTLVTVEVLLRLRPSSPHLACGGWGQDVPLGFSPDGCVLVTTTGHAMLPAINYHGYHSAPVRLWDTLTGEARAALYQQHMQVSAGCFSPDSRMLAIKARHDPLEFWGISDGRLLGKLPDSTKDVQVHLRFSPLGKTLAFVDSGDQVRVWDAASLQELVVLNGASGPIAYSLDGEMLATGSESRAIHLWDVATGRKLASLTGHTDEVLSITFSPDGEFLISGQGARQWWPYVNYTPKPPRTRILVWELRTGQQWGSLEWTHVGELAFSANNKTVIVGGGTGDPAALWSIERKGEPPKLIDSWIGHRRAMSPDGRRMAIIDVRKSSWMLRLLETDQWEEISTFRADGAYHPWGYEPELRFSPDSKQLLLVESQWSEPSEWPEWLGQWFHRPNKPECMQVVRVFDAAMGKHRATLRAPGRRVKCSPEGKLAATIDDAGTIAIWDIPPRRPSRLAVAAAILLSLGVMVVGYWFVRRFIGFILARKAPNEGATASPQSPGSP